MLPRTGLAPIGHLSGAFDICLWRSCGCAKRPKRSRSKSNTFLAGTMSQTCSPRSLLTSMSTFPSHFGRGFISPLNDESLNLVWTCPKSFKTRFISSIAEVGFPAGKSPGKIASSESSSPDHKGVKHGFGSSFLMHHLTDDQFHKEALKELQATDNPAGITY